MTNRQLANRFPSQSPGAHAFVWVVGVVLLAMFTGCATTKPKNYEPVIARFYLETGPEGRGSQPLELPVSGTTIVVDPRVVISEADFVRVEMVRVDLGMCLMFVMGTDTSRGLTVLTSSNLGRRLVLTLNGKPVGARMIDAPITNGRLFTFVEIPDEDLAATTLNLQATTADIQEAVRKSRGR